MGVFFYTNSVAFIEDIPLAGEEYSDPDTLATDITQGFQQVQGKIYCSSSF